MSAAVALKVLILEDQPLIVMDIEDTLLAHGFEIAAVLSSCRSALKWLKTGTSDVVVLDIELQDGNCVEVAKYLNERKIPFVVHSGSVPNSPDLDPVFQGGIWIGKPCLEADLIAAIDGAAALNGPTPQ